MSAPCDESPPEPEQQRVVDLEVDFDHQAYAPAWARHAVQMLVPPTDPASFALGLITSELVTNVVVHTEHGGRLRVTHPEHGDGIRIEVSDSDTRRPELSTQTGQSGGRGLLIVSELAAAWGVDVRNDGKTVWADVDHTSSRTPSIIDEPVT